MKREGDGATPVMRLVPDAVVGALLFFSGLELAVGLEHIDLDAARKKGIAVLYTPDVLSDSVAEMAILLMLGALGLLLGNKKARNFGGKALTYGGLAALGVIAYKAYGNWQAQQGTAPKTEPQTLDRVPPAQVEQHSQAILKALVAAAKADGHEVADVAEAAKRADVIMLLVPDQDMRPIYEEGVAGALGRCVHGREPGVERRARLAVDVELREEREGHVMAHELEVRVLQQVRHVAPPQCRAWTHIVRRGGLRAMPPARRRRPSRRRPRRIRSSSRRG